MQKQFPLKLFPINPSLPSLTLATTTSCMASTIQWSKGGSNLTHRMEEAQETGQREHQRMGSGGGHLDLSRCWKSRVLQRKLQVPRRLPPLLWCLGMLLILGNRGFPSSMIHCCAAPLPLSLPPGEGCLTISSFRFLAMLKKQAQK